MMWAVGNNQGQFGNGLILILSTKDHVTLTEKRIDLPPFIHVVFVFLSGFFGLRTTHPLT